MPLPDQPAKKRNPRGRPARSEVRQHIAEILSCLGKAYGYDIYRHYRELFPRVSMRLIYYHLKKGVSLRIFSVEGVRTEEGSYSWGSRAEKVYYSLGPKAAPSRSAVVEKYFKEKKRTQNGEGK